jgi:hypothetical protein
MSEEDIARLLEAARPSAWLRGVQSKTAERERVDAVRQLREIWRGQIEGFERTQDAEIARYNTAEAAGRGEAVDGAAKIEEARGVSRGSPVRVRFERAEPVRADYVDARLDRFFAQVGRDLLAAPNPIVAMKRFLDGDRGQGRPPGADAEAAGHLIFGVEKFRAEGETLDGALARIAEIEPSPRGGKPLKGDGKERVKKRYERALKSRDARLIGVMMLEDWKVRNKAKSSDDLGDKI